MAFPTSPSNGDTYVVGDVTYTYNSSSNRWVGTLPVSQSSGGSMGAPTHYLKTTLEFSITLAEHANGDNNGYNGLKPQSNQYITLANTQSKNNGSMVTVNDNATYGNITMSTVPGAQFANAPQFCDTASFLASNPTWANNMGNANGVQNYAGYWCANTLTWTYSVDHGNTWGTYVPPPSASGQIRFPEPGKYKVTVNPRVEVSGSTNTYTKYKQQFMLLDGNTIVTRDYSQVEYVSVDAASGVKPVFKEPMSAIVTIATANTSLDIAYTKLGNNLYTTHLVQFHVESLF